jgi:signal transduction histidine kinase
MEAQYRLLELGRLSAGIFHDLSSPLTTLSLTVERLENLGPNESERIKNEIHSLKRTFTCLDGFIKLIQNNLRTECTDTIFCAESSIKDVCNMISHRIISLNILMIIRIKRKILITGNPHRFQQVVLNIINNGIDVLSLKEESFSRKIVIRIRKEHGKYILDFSDNGNGMTEEIRVRIFNPFFTTKESTGGIGIGLAHTKEIIEKEFGGNIFVSSEVGKGTRFSIHLHP